jgi:hypothetical protein
MAGGEVFIPNEYLPLEHQIGEHGRFVPVEVTERESGRVRMEPVLDRDREPMLAALKAGWQPTLVTSASAEAQREFLEGMVEEGGLGLGGTIVRNLLTRMDESGHTGAEEAEQGGPQQEKNDDHRNPLRPT